MNLTLNLICIYAMLTYEGLKKPVTKDQRQSMLVANFYQMKIFDDA